MTYIIKRGSEYLVAVLHTKPQVIRWSIYRYDAARIDRRADAERVARITGGDVLTFYPAEGVTV